MRQATECAKDAVLVTPYIFAFAELTSYGTILSFPWCPSVRGSLEWEGTHNESARMHLLSSVTILD